MPELAEVEYYRQRWDCGLGHRITAVKLHPEKRIFRGTDVAGLQKILAGAILQESAAHGKQLVFRFSSHAWLGLHLGMTGKLSVAAPNLSPGKHDHLVLVQSDRSLVFTDSRQFGRVRFHHGDHPPAWWAELPPPINSRAFTRRVMTQFLAKHGRVTIKAALLLQRGFPGLGNWMADEMLWRARIDPRTKVARLSISQRDDLWKALRFVTRGAMKHVGRDFSDPPADWLFHQRWKRNGRCPIHKKPLQRQTVGGRTTAWCKICQPPPKGKGAGRTTEARGQATPPGG
ncbi:MAG: DNA-formamidopyrimidine glycosylase family protein [Verrucomicrobiota bacterium]